MTVNIFFSLHLILTLSFQVLDLLEGHPIFTLSGHGGAVNSVNFSPSGDLFATAGEDKLVRTFTSMR